MTLQEFIIQYREEHNLSQRELAKKCGLSNGYISMLESGKNPNTNEPIIPKIDVFVRMASGTNMTVDELLTIIDDTPCEIQDELVHYKSLFSVSGTLTDHETEVITAYRDQPDKRPIVDKILDVDQEDHTIFPIAAYDGHDEKIVISEDENIDNAPDLKL